jgi:hypothetical protein
VDKRKSTRIQSDPKQIQNKTNGAGVAGHGLVRVYPSFIQALPRLWIGWGGAKVVWLLAIRCQPLAIWPSMGWKLSETRHKARLYGQLAVKCGRRAGKARLYRVRCSGQLAKFSFAALAGPFVISAGNKVLFSILLITRRSPPLPA